MGAGEGSGVFTLLEREAGRRGRKERERAVQTADREGRDTERRH